MYKPEIVNIEVRKSNDMYRAKDGTTHNILWHCFLHDYQTPDNKDIYNARLLQQVVRNNMWGNTIYVFNINNIEEFYIMLANFHGAYYLQHHDLLSYIKVYDEGEFEYVIIYDDNGDCENIIIQQKFEYLKELTEEIEQYTNVYRKVLGE